MVLYYGYIIFVKTLNMTWIATMLTQDVIWTLIQRFLYVMDVRLVSKERCVLTGNGDFIYIFYSALCVGNLKNPSSTLVWCLHESKHKSYCINYEWKLNKRFIISQDSTISINIKDCELFFKVF